MLSNKEPKEDALMFASGDPDLAFSIWERLIESDIDRDFHIMIKEPIDDDEITEVSDTVITEVT